MLVTRGLWPEGENRFTLPFRKTITIDAESGGGRAPRTRGQQACHSLDNDLGDSDSGDLDLGDLDLGDLRGQNRRASIVPA